jgi:hypothetical protein
LLKKEMGKKGQAWEIHLSLFPVVQRVLNPPFINPHLPKMYRIYRELIPYLREDEIPALVRLEINEYARRRKLEKIPKAPLLTSPVSFQEVESAIRGQDREKAAVLMATFGKQQGGAELARKFLLLGSGYLDHSLGHSVSCSAFILLEMLERKGQDPWPALATLADYFCKGRFHTTPDLRETPEVLSDKTIEEHLLRAASGTGIVNLHHTITFYAIQRARHFFSPQEFQHLIHSWIHFLGDKQVKVVEIVPSPAAPEPDDSQFRAIFSRREEKSVVAFGAGMIGSQQGRKTLGRFLLKGLGELYPGDYDPHFITGLGSVLWILDHYRERRPIAVTALTQYINYYFESMKGK